MADSSNIYASLFDIYTSQFTQQWQAVMQKAAYAFRTTETVKGVSAVLAELAKLAAQADALVADLQAKKIDAKAFAAQSTNLDTLMTAQVSSLQTALKSLQGLDQKTLTKAATLDQVGLKTLAAELKSGADATLNTNVENFVNKVSTGLAAVANGEAADPELDINAATEKALKTIGKATGEVDKSQLETTRRDSGAATAFWL